jgi:hemerythrin superfamily protein
MAKAKDVLALIEADHRKVEELFEQLEKAKSAKKTYEFLTQIYKEVNLHARAEELVFYPAMREYDETTEFIEEAESEHEEAEILLEQIKGMSPSDEQFQDKIEQLKEAIQHHVEEEESEIFKAVRECMDADQLKSLGQEFQEAKSKLEQEVVAAIK